METPTQASLPCQGAEEATGACWLRGRGWGCRQRVPQGGARDLLLGLASPRRDQSQPPAGRALPK